MKLNIYNIKAEKVGQQDIDPNIFEVPIKMNLIHESLRIHMANSRKVLAHTKGRAEVRGGGKKPWKQKGTGRARHGSIRSPLWVGGGVTFGPTNERNYTLKINKKAKRKALCMTLSDKTANNRLILLDNLVLETGKTKSVVAILNNFKKLIEQDGKIRKVLWIYPEKAGNLIMATKNVKKLKVLGANNLNIKDLLNYEYIMMEQGALEKIDKLYSVNKKSKINDKF
ncbi:50S ribosomal protein L4 [Patescibacteria group bacterium]